MLYPAIGSGGVSLLITVQVQRVSKMTPRIAANNRLRLTVMNKMPKHKGQRAAAEPERYPD
jgi:hypothetical protein